jgi:hypothetical protein
MYGIESRSRPPTVERNIRAELDRLAATLRLVWTTLPSPMTLEWSDSLVVALSRGSPWIYGPVEQNPLRNARGATVLPQRVRARLKKVAAWRVPVHHLLPALQSGPQTCTDEVARALVGELPVHPWLARAVRGMDVAVNGAISAARGAVQLAGKVLDPVIFGVLAPAPPRHGDLCLWYPLTAWRW